MVSDLGPRNSSRQRAYACRSFEHHVSDYHLARLTPILWENYLEVVRGLPPLFPFHQPHERTCGSMAI
ncbi:hypothetical protein TNCV_588651 [Trichonephila clavipes]|nr:hypothetical protein TNCV_588651 [Trichonephila clavipes]